jgi:hypothetical protein
MRNLLLLLVAACGGQPALANAPRPDPGVVAGAAAAAAAAATLADPDAATRRPEKKQETEKREVEVKERVTPDVFDRLDNKKAQGSAAQPASTDDADAKPDAKPDGKTAKPNPKKKPPKIPSPKDFVDKNADKSAGDK